MSTGPAEELGTIGRANLDGSNPNEDFITGANLPTQVAVDGADIYWTSSSGPGSIGRANLGGTGVNQSFIGGQSHPSGIVLGGPGAQAIKFTSTAPTDATVGGASYTVTATGGATGNPVSFAIDSASSAVCAISGATVTFTAPGTCTDRCQTRPGTQATTPRAKPSKRSPSAQLRPRRAIHPAERAARPRRRGSATHWRNASGGRPHDEPL